MKEESCCCVLTDLQTNQQADDAFEASSNPQSHSELFRQECSKANKTGILSSARMQNTHSGILGSHDKKFVEEKLLFHSCYPATTMIHTTTTGVDYSRLCVYDHKTIKNVTTTPPIELLHGNVSKYIPRPLVFGLKTS